MRMSLNDAIRHAEEVAEEQEKLCKRYDDASGYTRSHNEDIRTSDAKKCEKCSAEHRQLAKWLKDYKRLLEQEPKTGDWIKLPYMAIEADGTLLFSHKCSSCNGIGYFRRSEDKIVGGLFCPNCRAKMVEPQESESKRCMELAKSFVQGLRAGLAESEGEE